MCQQGKQSGSHFCVTLVIQPPVGAWDLGRGAPRICWAVPSGPEPATRPELRAAKVLWIVGLGPAPLPSGKSLPLHLSVEHTRACHLLHACLFCGFHRNHDVESFPSRLRVESHRMSHLHPQNRREAFPISFCAMLSFTSAIFSCLSRSCRKVGSPCDCRTRIRCWRRPFSGRKR